MGPGRKLYHKPCLACTSCSKRLDSFTLLEHDEQPYCKSCHLKLFGTRDLRHANLPQASPPASPTHTLSSPARPGSSAGFASGSMNAGTPAATPPRAAPPPSFWATRAVGAPSPSWAPRAQGPVRAPAWDDDDGTYSPAAAHHHTADAAAEAEAEEAHEIAAEVAEIADEREVREALVAASPPTQPQLQDPQEEAAPPVRTIPLALSPARTPYRHYTSHSVGAAVPSTETASSAPSTTPIRALPTGTGTRYGVALGGVRSGSPGPSPSAGTGVGMGMGSPSPLRAQATGAARWGGAGGETPLCARCAGRVYFAEQVKAVNKTFHKGCLRCTACGTSLDSRSLRDHEGTVFCARCYAKSYGPQGGGYALLGKAGG
ncbi:hypothetical protein HYPSUDRAFT_41203 [Hypholoma sublateritium FD-334 SS-4]|uniref:LIM zinc-binding domain-containing protein n=1 Tax=Hypholoma sublateritium (strain FD-334 SS-4) TaxID=945553 RepID=A0A0D2NT76_HYPSF|nr:hypothetical protein HYPSUDRAFT_41203 [Hypholoma sublateritium FD-334 SS-4]